MLGIATVSQTITLHVSIKVYSMGGRQKELANCKQTHLGTGAPPSACHTGTTLLGKVMSQELSVQGPGTAGFSAGLTAHQI